MCAALWSIFHGLVCHSLNCWNLSGEYNSYNCLCQVFYCGLNHYKGPYTLWLKLRQFFYKIFLWNSSLVWKTVKYRQLWEKVIVRGNCIFCAYSSTVVCEGINLESALFYHPLIICVERWDKSGVFFTLMLVGQLLQYKLRTVNVPV